MKEVGTTTLFLGLSITMENFTATGNVLALNMCSPVLEQKQGEKKQST
jgi:hypothetical protein